jgi:hypothetical protein
MTREVWRARGTGGSGAFKQKTAAIARDGLSFALKEAN